MDSTPTNTAEEVKQRFVGRQDALDEFYQRFAYIHMQNGVYYVAGGGTGKTWVLLKIIEENLEDPTRFVTPMIDFLTTGNGSIQGLQKSLRQRLEPLGPEKIFEPYQQLLMQIETARPQRQSKDTGLLASLESQANKKFIECCRKAIQGKQVIVLFDTFERVQQRDVGRWLLRDFLPEVRGLIIAIGGRAEPHKAEMPGNIKTFELGGLSDEDIRNYILKTFKIEADDPKALAIGVHKKTGGNPLLINLIFDLADKKYLTTKDVEDLPFDREELKRDLLKQFQYGSDLDRAFWAMAFLRRRFNPELLRFLVDKADYFETGIDGFEALFANLRQWKFIKEYPESESHLLHDEMQQMVTDHLLNNLVDPRFRLRRNLYKLVVDGYYVDHISIARDKGELELVRQLMAERFGYQFDEHFRRRKFDQGLDLYYAERREIDRTHDHDFEELLWGEVRGHLRELPDSGYELAMNRADWLQRHSLFDKAEAHYRMMIELYSKEALELRKYLGFSLLRQGEHQEAIQVFQEGMSQVRESDYAQKEAYFNQSGEFRNLLGQAHRYASQWDEAIKDYMYAARAFTLSGNDSGLAGVYVNRAYLQSVQGNYQQAIDDCNRAIELLKPALEVSEDARNTYLYAWLNLGTAYRHKGDFPLANQHYLNALELARGAKSRSAECNALQQLGINASLEGRKLRYAKTDWMVALKLQQQAWDNLIQAVNIARESNWQTALADSLSRLAKVCEEAYRLEETGLSLKNFADKLPERLSDFKSLMNEFNPPLEVEYEHDLRLRKLFSQLSGLERSAHLFDLSAIAAINNKDFHRSVDSLMELARLLLELRRYTEVRLALRSMERLINDVSKSQKELFSEMANLTLADLEVEEGRSDAGLKKYAEAYGTLAKMSGYASYLLDDRFRGLIQRLENLPVEQRLDWCDQLEERWLEASVSTIRPQMLQALEDIRRAALKKAKQG